MKTTYTFTKLFLLVAILFAAVSCSENEKEVVVEPEFPEEEVVSSVTPNGETILTFSANMNWEVTSSAIWCKFANGSTSIKGEAGDISLPLTITEDAWSVEESVVEITLKMGGEEKVIAKYTRAGKTPVITNADGEEYGEENPIVLTYTNNGVSGSFNFVANYDWEIKEENLPSWLKVPENGSQMGGNAGESVLVTFEVAKNFWANAQTGNVVIKAKNSDVSVSIPVSFSGIPEGVIAVDGINGTAFWWKISADGKNFWKDGSLDGSDVEKFAFPLSFNVIAKDNAYKVVQLYRADSGWLTVPDGDYFKSFISLKENALGEVTIESVEANNSDMRDAYVYVLPVDLYNELSAGGDIATALCDADGEISFDYEKYVVMAFKQEASSSSSAAFSLTVNGSSVEVTPGDGGTNIGGSLMSEYSLSADAIYSVKVAKNSSLVVDPMLSQMEWPDPEDYMIVYTLTDGEVDKSGWELQMNSNETGYIWKVPVKESFFIVFRVLKGENIINEKALIIVCE